MRLYNISEFEKIASDDFNNSQKVIHQSLYDKILYNFLNKENGFLGTSLRPTRSDANTVELEEGRGFVFDAAVVDAAAPKYQAIQLNDADTVTIPSAGAGTFRRDRIVAKSQSEVLTQEERFVKTGGVGPIALQDVDKIIEQTALLLRVAGTPAATAELAALPAIPAGYISVAETLSSDTGMAVDGVTDSRNVLTVAQDIRIDTTGYERLPVSGATLLTEIVAAIDVLLKTGWFNSAEFDNLTVALGSATAGRIRLYFKSGVPWIKDESGNAYQLDLVRPVLKQTFAAGPAFHQIDFSIHNQRQLTLTANLTSLDAIGLEEGKTYLLYLAQDITGSRTITLWPGEFRFAANTAPTLTTTPLAVDLLIIRVKDGQGYVQSILNFSEETETGIANALRFSACDGDVTAPRSMFLDPQGNFFHNGVETQYNLFDGSQVRIYPTFRSATNTHRRASAVMMSLDTTVFVEKGSSFPWGGGRNTFGILGQNNETLRSSPVSVLGGRRVKQFVIGTVQLHSAMLTDEGFAYCMGANNNGNCGDNTITDRSSPVSVVGGRRWKMIGGQGGRTNAIELSTGLLFGWGNNDPFSGANGENNMNVARSSPTLLAGSPRSYVFIPRKFGGQFNTTPCAIDGGGFAWCWGNNTYGQVGDNSVSDRSSPTSVVGGRTWNKIYNFDTVTYGIEKTTGSLYGWGTAPGVPFMSGYSSPTLINAQRSWVNIDGDSLAGNNIILLEDGDGVVYGYGANTGNCMGLPSALASSMHMSKNSERSYAKVFKTGVPHVTLVMTGAGVAYPINGTFAHPATVGANSRNFIHRSLNVVFRTLAKGGGDDPEGVPGNGHSMGIEAVTNRPYAWGFNTYGQIGKGDDGVSLALSPTSVIGGRSASHAAVGYNYGSFIDAATGFAWSMGVNESGQLGVNTIANVSSPTSVVGARSYKDIAAGAYTTHFIDGAGFAWGCGLGTNGQVGDNTTTNRSSPVSVVGAKVFKAVDAGATCTAFIDSNDFAWMIGANDNGQLGDNTTTHRSSPVSVVGGRTFRKVSVGSGHVLGLDFNGVVWAWGDGTYGAIGDNVYPIPTPAHRSSPVSVSGQTGRSFIDIMAKYHSSAAIDEQGRIWSWGTVNDGPNTGDGVGRDVGATLAGSSDKIAPLSIWKVR